MPHIARLRAYLLKAGDDEGGAFPLHGLVALAYEAGAWVERWREG
jgi:hypothetical protein